VACSRTGLSRRRPDCTSCAHAPPRRAGRRRPARVRTGHDAAAAQQRLPDGHERHAAPAGQRPPQRVARLRARAHRPAARAGGDAARRCAARRPACAAGQARHAPRRNGHGSPPAACSTSPHAARSPPPALSGWHARRAVSMRRHHTRRRRPPPPRLSLAAALPAAPLAAPHLQDSAAHAASLHQTLSNSRASSARSTNAHRPAPSERPRHPTVMLVTGHAAPPDAARPAHLRGQQRPRCARWLWCAARPAWPGWRTTPARAPARRGRCRPSRAAPCRMKGTRGLF